MNKAKDMISTRLDEESLFKLSYITESEDCQNRSEAIKTAINMAYESILLHKKNWKQSVLESGFIGASESGNANTSNTYKDIIGNSLDEKWSS